MKKAILLNVLIAITLVEITGQSLFIQRSSAKIYELLPNGYLEHSVTIQDFSDFGFDHVFDIAISPSNKLYGITGTNGIIEIDWDTGAYEIISSDTNLGSSSLVCGDENNLYYLDVLGKLFRYNIPLDTAFLIAELEYSTPGDICFYKGNVIFPTQADIKAYNLETGSLSTIYCFADSTNYFGISMVDSDCDSAKVYIPSILNPTFHQIDLHTGITANYYVNNPSAISIWGMASDEEFLGLDCGSYKFNHIDCGEVTSIGSTNKTEIAIEVFPNPVEDLLSIKGHDDISEIKLFNSYGRLINYFVGTKRQIDVSHLPAGVYYVAINCKNKRQIRKIIKT